ncbi:ABC transporter ATP-binding protein [Pontibacter chitinilyticus]|uniref:ABC transporter ATP-binding protein n=1 Tax=Pontibacter chitinilyticus TaxID=2674989 RepID=UPI00321A74F8
MIQIHNATKMYGPLAAVDAVSLEVSKGETLVLLGTSGSGKTTTLKLINRLEELTSGSIAVAGKDIQQQPPEELRRQMGYVIQGAGLFPHYTVQENIAVVPRLLGWQKKQTTQRTEEVLEMLHLPAQEYLHKYPHQLSGGQQQRVGLARALVSDPPVVLMDEPFGALDPITRHSIRHEFKHLKALQDKTIVLVTHDVQEAFELADRICLMDGGQVQQVGTPKELVFRPANTFVGRFLQQHIFQLQLQVLTLQDLLPYLQPLPTATSATTPLPASTPVLQALQQLTGTSIATQSINILQKNAGQLYTVGTAELMAAVAEATQNQLPYD